MSPERRFAAFVIAGGLLGVAVVVGGLLATGYDARAACPDGWTIRPDRSTPLGTAVRTCGPATPGRNPAKLHLLWTATGALDDARLEFVARGNGFSGGAGVERVQDHGVEGAALAWERQGGTLKSDVYFLSAGQRHGLLSVVYGPDSSWGSDDTVAPWLESIEGTAPWGAPVTPTLRARCPQGFTALRAEAPGLVLRCMQGIGTESFTVLQLTQSEGGFGSEGDRARLARDVAQRVASGRGGQARTLAEPQPFTAARNVDAIRARYETAERVTTNTRVAWARTPASGNVSVLYVGPDTEEATVATVAFIRGVHASRVAASVLWSLGALCLIAGVALGMRATRRDELNRA